LNGETSSTVVTRSDQWDKTAMEGWASLWCVGFLLLLLLYERRSEENRFFTRSLILSFSRSFARHSFNRRTKENSYCMKIIECPDFFALKQQEKTHHRQCCSFSTVDNIENWISSLVHSVLLGIDNRIKQWPNEFNVQLLNKARENASDVHFDPWPGACLIFEKYQLIEITSRLIRYGSTIKLQLLSMVNPTCSREWNNYNNGLLDMHTPISLFIRSSHSHRYRVHSSPCADQW
jgi:hypothetical protein